MNSNNKNSELEEQITSMLEKVMKEEMEDNESIATNYQSEIENLNNQSI